MCLFFIWAKSCGSTYRKSFKNKRMMTVYFLPHRTSNSIFRTFKACTLMAFIIAMKFKIWNEVSKSSTFRNRSLTEPLLVSNQFQNFLDLNISINSRTRWFCLFVFQADQVKLHSFRRGPVETALVFQKEHVKLHFSKFYFCPKIIVSSIKIPTILTSAVSPGPYQLLWVQFHLVPLKNQNAESPSSPLN